jgi:hypothetical protein
MAFKVLFMAHSPDADKDKHRSVIETGKYKLFTVVMKNQIDAVTVAKEMFEKENIDSIILCPGFTHEDVADLFRVLKGKVSINVARGDGPSNQISQSVIQKEFVV